MIAKYRGGSSNPFKAWPSIGVFVYGVGLTINAQRAPLAVWSRRGLLTLGLLAAALAPQALCGVPRVVAGLWRVCPVAVLTGILRDPAQLGHAVLAIPLVVALSLLTVCLRSSPAGRELSGLCAGMVLPVVKAVKAFYTARTTSFSASISPHRLDAYGKGKKEWHLHGQDASIRFTLEPHRRGTRTQKSARTDDRWDIVLWSHEVPDTLCTVYGYDPAQELHALLVLGLETVRDNAHSQDWEAWKKRHGAHRATSFEGFAGDAFHRAEQTWQSAATGKLYVGLMVCIILRGLWETGALQQLLPYLMFAYDLTLHVVQYAWSITPLS